MDCLGATSAGAAGATTVGSAASTVAAGDFDPFFDWHAPLEERDCKFPMQVNIRRVDRARLAIRRQLLFSCLISALSYAYSLVP